MREIKKLQETSEISLHKEIKDLNNQLNKVKTQNLYQQEELKKKYSEVIEKLQGTNELSKASEYNKSKVLVPLLNLTPRYVPSHVENAYLLEEIKTIRLQNLMSSIDLRLFYEKSLVVKGSSINLSKLSEEFEKLKEEVEMLRKNNAGKFAMFWKFFEVLTNSNLFSSRVLENKNVCATCFNEVIQLLKEETEREKLKNEEVIEELLSMTKVLIN